MATIVLVHGAFHGPWCFEPLVSELADRGIDVVAPELPLSSLSADAAAVVAALDEVEGPVTLLGHSYGGAVVTVAGTHPAVARLVYLAAMAPDTGEGASGGPAEIGAAFMEALRTTDDGRMEVAPDRAVAVFYPDAEPERAEAFAARLRPGAAGGPDDVVDEAAWRTRPTAYVVCDADPILLPDAQRAIAARTGATVREIAGDHSPFLTRPAELADLLADLVV
jgi:pimeloyl-ACP methyl ester carboxylesterase